MNCPLCFNKSTQKLSPFKEKVYHHCSQCDLIFLDRAFYLTEAQEKERYLLHDNSKENQGYVQYLNQFINFIKPSLSSDPHDHILDFGCGPEPLLAEFLENQEYKVNLYDPYFHRDSNWQNTSYSAIIVHEVIEHLKTPGILLAQWHKILQPGGQLMIRTGFHPSNFQDFFKWWYIQDSTHIVFFSLKSFKWLEKTGFWAIKKTDNKSMIILKKSGH